AERFEYGQVVPSHPPLGDLYTIDAENCSEIKSHFATRRWKWTHLSLLRTLIRGPCSDKVSFGDQKLDHLDRIGKNCRILLQEVLDLIETPNLDSRSCFAMADNIRCDKVVERISLTFIPSVKETLD